MAQHSTRGSGGGRKWRISPPDNEKRRHETMLLRRLATSSSIQTAAVRRSPNAPLFAAYSTYTKSTSVNHNREGSSAAAVAALVGLVAASAATQEGGSTVRCQAAISPNEPVLKGPIVMVDKSGARLEGRPFALFCIVPRNYD